VGRGEEHVRKRRVLRAPLRIIVCMSPAEPSLDPDACYLALKTHDARFDGSFFTGVTSTGIYCRPVCRVRTPRRDNCRFFALAAQAESAGFRPCLRCRPELAPQGLRWSLQDASALLAQQAARLLEEPQAWAAPEEGSVVAALARKLGISDRHLRRIFEDHLGVSPLQYLQTRRLLQAKQLLADTQLPVTEIALASGFRSVRRFNAVFTAQYGLSPGALRRTGEPAAAGSHVRLGYRPPYDVDAMLAFFRTRAIDGVEAVGERRLARTLALDAQGRRWQGWIALEFDAARCELVLRVGDSLQGVLPLVIRRVRAAFDLDADPQAINARLHGSFPGGDGLRVPGAFSGYELAVRAVLGQQVTVAAARTLAQRLVQRFGTAIDTPEPQLRLLFPAPEVLAVADGDALGQLGIVRQRQAAIVAIARGVADGVLALHPGADVASTTTALKALPGIGDWTAQYIAMRALRWPDAFPAGDVALHKALGVREAPQPARAAEAASQAWKPWRSYAVVRAWSALAQGA
jgi:AraC family transcriptional regulator, regulatory protein of adaptative response / DNA-3-methyladenine glycosylase II